MTPNLFLQGLTVDWQAIEPGSWLRAIPALRGLERLEFHRGITFFCGENGSGKSTLLEGIAGAYGFNREGGTLNYRFSTYEEEAGLSQALRLSKGFRRARAGYFFRAESFYNVATAAKERYGGFEDYHAQSHGEGSLHFLQSYDREGLFLMDEPEAALSPQRQLGLLLHIHRLAQAGAQFIIASHSPILLGMPDAELLRFGEDGIRPVSFEETESYQITSLYLRNRSGFLRELLRQEDDDDTGD